MTPSTNCFAIIREFEGLKLKAYLCPAKVPTIGYGSTGPDIKLGMVWTLDQAKARLEKDVTKFAEGVAKLIGKTATTQGQFDAMVSLAYNIGVGAFAKSSVLANHLAKRPVNAAGSFLLWNKATVGGKKVVLAGLDRRRKAEAELYLA